MLFLKFLLVKYALHFTQKLPDVTQEIYSIARACQETLNTSRFGVEHSGNL